MYAKKFTWFDTGNAIELTKTRKHFKEENSPNILPKPDEAIWFVNNDVIKYSNNKKFITDRVKRTEFLDGFVPKIKAHTENMYSYKKEEGIVLSKIEDVSLFKDLLEFCSNFWVKQSLCEEENKQFLDTCKDFYYTKTLSRLDLYYETFKMKDCEYIINGKNYPKLSDILDKVNWKNICNGLAGRFHGDFHFENIIYNSQNKTFTFLDWRQNFGKILEYGDIYYDLAKLLHGLIICHELIAQNKYNIQIDSSNIEYSFERKQILEECEQLYYNWLQINGYDLPKVKIMTALIYLNIAALHHYPYCHLLYFLGVEMLYENI